MIAYIFVISICIFCELFYLRYSHKRCGLTIYNIFYLGMIVLLFCGALSACLFDSIGMTSSIFDKYGIEVLELIVGDQIVFALIATVFLLLQPHNKHAQLGVILPSPQLERYANIIGLFTIGFWCLLLLNINLSQAPLLNIGEYSYSEMLTARRNLFSNVESFTLLRFLALYMVIPCIFLLKGMGSKIYTWMLPVFLFISVLTLSKTAFVIDVFMYFMGRYLKSKCIRGFLWMILWEVVGFYIIVASTYWVDVRRNFLDVTLVLIRRFIEVPISLSANYAQIFNFDEGFRQSMYYVLLFGGNQISISQLAGFRLFGDAAVLATTGIIGMAYPNIPYTLHYFYYAFFVLLVYISSVITSNIRELTSNITLIKSMLIIISGTSASMFFMTDPLTVMNTYGFMWLTFISFIIYFISLYTTEKSHKSKYQLHNIKNIK